MPLSTIFQLQMYIMATSFSGGGSRSTRREPPTIGKQLVNFITCDWFFSIRNWVTQWVRSLDLTTHTSLSPIRRGFVPSFVNYKNGALDSQVIKLTSCLPSYELGSCPWARCTWYNILNLVWKSFSMTCS
jgi:hypothetical protein